MHPVHIFFSYAHEDEDLMHDVRRQFIVYERNGIIEKWYDRKILPGQEWENEIDERLSRAHIVLFLVSPHFIESNYCYEVEMKKAIKLHEVGKTIVIPIILRPCAWAESLLGKLQALPQDGKPITQWQDRDEVCLSVALAVMNIANRTLSPGNELEMQAPTPDQEPADTAPKSLWGKPKNLQAVLIMTFITVIAVIVVVVAITNSRDKYVDPRDQQSYTFITVDSLQWLSQNLNYSLESNSWCYNNNKSNCKKFGRLYNWEGANKACSGMGAGWRLPSHDDLDVFANYIEEHDKETLFPGLLGGELSPPDQFLHLEENGMVWSNTESRDDYVWILYVYGRSNKLDLLYHGGKEHGYSCRCVRKVPTNSN